MEHLVVHDYRGHVERFLDSAGETVGTGCLTDLERARAALGLRASHAKLLLFAPTFTPELRSVATTRADVELVDLERLYYGD